MAKHELTRRQFLKALPVVAGLPFILSNSGRVDAARLSSPDIRRKPIPEPGQIIAYHDSLTPSHVYFAVVEAHNEFGENPSNGIVERFGGSNSFLRVTLSEGSTAMGGVTSYVDLEKIKLVDRFGQNLTMQEINTMVRNGRYNIGAEFDQRQRYQMEALLAKNIVLLNQEGISKENFAPKNDVSIRKIEGSVLDVTGKVDEITVSAPHDVVTGDMLRRLQHSVGSLSLKRGLIEWQSFMVAGASQSEGIGSETIRPKRVACTPDGTSVDQIATIIIARQALIALQRAQMPDFPHRIIKEAIRKGKDVTEDDIRSLIREWYPNNSDVAIEAFNGQTILHCN